MPGKLLELTQDLVFQELFGKPKNKDITSHLLSLILGREINNIDLDANKRMLGNSENAKTGRLDIRAKFNNGEDCNIELQVDPYKFMDKRMLDYWAAMYLAKINRGKDYQVLKPSISILIADYKLQKLSHIPKYHTVWNLRETEYTDTIISNDIEMHILEIPKIKDSEILKDELARWMKFIKNPGDEEVQKIMEENKFYKQARKELAYLSGDPDFQRLLESRAGFLMDMESYAVQREEEAEAKGKAEGKSEAIIETAKKLLKMGLSIEQIIEATGLTKEEIEKLK